MTSVAILQPQSGGFAGRGAGAAADSSGRHTKRRTYGPWENKPATPTVGQRIKRTRVAQTVGARAAQPKPPRPSFFRRVTSWFTNTEVADSMRARTDARRVKNRGGRAKPPKIRRRR